MDIEMIRELIPLLTDLGEGAFILLLILTLKAYVLSLIWGVIALLIVRYVAGLIHSQSLAISVFRELYKSATGRGQYGGVVQGEAMTVQKYVERLRREASEGED